jgi:hypothetical protein
MDPNGSYWILMDPDGSRWILLDPIGFYWILLDPGGSWDPPFPPCISVCTYSFRYYSDSVFELK